MALTDLIEDFNIDNDTIDLKFAVSLKTATLVNENFVLTLDLATPVEVADAFQEIIIKEDYNSISRVLQLRWDEDVLEAGTDYRLTISNLQTVVGHILLPIAITFTTSADTTNPVDVPLETPPEIVDYSIKTAVFDVTSLGTGGATVPFGIEDSDPIQGDFYLPPDFNNGRLEVTFTSAPDLGTINSDTVRLQKRSIVRGPSRWSNVDIQVSSSGSTIYIDLPSVDHYPEAATPSTTTVYHTDDFEYFEENTKYRLILSKSILADGSTPAELLYADEMIYFAGEFDPMLIDPAELSSVFPDAPASEIAEQIYFASLEVVAITGIDLDTTAPTYLMLDYVKAAAACALSRTFDYATGDEQSVRLGDLDVVNRVFPKNSANRSNATTWCELAAALRKELQYETTGMRGVVRGSSYDNPIPNRDLRNHDAGAGFAFTHPHRQGTLDDVDSDDVRRVF